MISVNINLPHWVYSFLDRKLGKQNWFSYYKNGRIHENRSWEVQLDHFGFRTLFGFELDLSMKGHSHAGPVLELNLLGFMFRAEAPDNRHWNYEANRWYKPGEESWDE